MKNLINKITTKCNSIAIRARLKIAEKRAEGYVDSALKIVIAVVIGGVLLAGLYTLFNTTVIPTMTSKVTEMFSYNGSAT